APASHGSSASGSRAWPAGDAPAPAPRASRRISMNAPRPTPLPR
ncbi:hypothetical protein BMAJHU_I0160, partial [Burkholderia mallei JHU]